MMRSSSRSTHDREEHDKKKGRLGRSLTEKSPSFHVPESRTLLRRPKTDPNLLSFQKTMNNKISSEEVLPDERLRKLLLNVNIQRSLGAVQVVMSGESTVGDLIVEVVRRYAKAERRPFLPTKDPSCFGLHYSTFTLESLDRKERLVTLGRRNFFLCVSNSAGLGSASSSSRSYFSNQMAPTFMDLSWPNNISCPTEIVKCMHVVSLDPQMLLIR